MAQIQNYILFPNHDNAMRLYRELKKCGISARISPTPRSVSTCCGVSLMVEADDLEQIRQIIQEKDVEIVKFAEVERDYNPTRGRYL